MVFKGVSPGGEEGSSHMFADMESGFLTYYICPNYS